MRSFLTCLAAAVLLFTYGCGTDNTCAYANDGECDDGRDCAVTALCALGTDSNDCVGVGGCDPANSCVYAFDGECDDGRTGSVTNLCDPGTDSSDCD